MKLPEEKTDVRNVVQASLDVLGIHVDEWHPLPDGQGPPTQVWMTLQVAGVDRPITTRFKGPDTIGLLIAALKRHRKNVWPDAEEVKE